MNKFSFSIVLTSLVLGTQASFARDCNFQEGEARHCLIAEVPDPDQINDSALKTRVTDVRRRLDSLDEGFFTEASNVQPIAVKITGQFFLDAPHIGGGDPGGGRGTLISGGQHCATNVWEVHPVTALETQ